MVASYFVLSALAVVCWAPILIRFYRNWLRRRNPISLAICSAITLLIWIAIAGIWEFSGDVRSELITFVSTGVSVVVGCYANLTFYLAQKKFDERKE